MQEFERWLSEVGSKIVTERRVSGKPTPDYLEREVKLMGIINILYEYTESASKSNPKALDALQRAAKVPSW